MPRGDGTGPRGLGPMTGRAKGKCILKIPDDCARPVEGFVGLNGKYVVFSARAERKLFPWRERTWSDREEMD